MITALKFANAIFSTFTLTTVMLTTFSDSFGRLEIGWCVVAGSVASILVFLIALSQIAMFCKQK